MLCIKLLRFLKLDLISIADLNITYNYRMKYGTS